MKTKIDGADLYNKRKLVATEENLIGIIAEI